MQTFYFLSKFLPTLIYPAGLTCLLLVVALVLRHHDRWRNGLIIVAMVTLWLGGHRIVSIALVGSLEWQYPSLDPAEVPPADAIIVLGGGTQLQLPPRPTHEVGEAGDRMIYAARLYREGVAPIVIVSGARGPFSTPGSVPEAEAMTELLVFMGVPRDAIILESASLNTYENGVECARILEERSMDEVVLVTSAMHMPRSMAIFEKYDLAITPTPTDYLATEPDWEYYTQLNLGVQLLNLLPRSDHLDMTSRALKEIIGTVIYGLRGWL